MGLGELSVLKISAVIAATLFSCLALASLGDSLSEKPGALRRGLNSQSVRVKVLSLTFPIEIRGQEITFKGFKKYPIQEVAIPRSETISIDHKVIAGNPVWIIQKGAEIRRHPGAFLELNSDSSRVRIGAFEIPGPVMLSARKSALQADVIVSVALEAYLENVLISEMPPQWPLEALKAQAIATRSYTLYQMKIRRDQPYHLEGSVLDQVYSLSHPSRSNERILTALRSTEGQVLSFNGKLLKAYYHSDCGGHTEEPEFVWGGSTAKIGTSPDTHESPFSRWSFEISMKELGNKLAALDHQLEEPQKLEILSHTPSQRVNQIAVDDGTSRLVISGNELRRVLGYEKLKSTLFTLTQEKGVLKFLGKGNGHGSGLCQWGARSLAEKGTKVSAILSRYYPNAQVTEVHVAHR
jgi:stage II sporulation protein D